jgi:hypothetical protein
MEHEMSQHIFETKYEGDPVTVVMGWDRPKQDYFMMISKERGAFTPPFIVYDNDIDDRSKGEGLDYYQATLLELGIEVPQVMLQHVHHDCGFNVGNRVCTYAADGKFTDIKGDLKRVGLWKVL